MLVPAKINLYLHIEGKRADGYHMLDSLIAFTDIYDEINITPAPNFTLEISGEFAPLVENDERNIVMRAYRLMQQECSNSDNIAIKLVKNIPVGAGLGGGSADAAATLIILNEIWQAGLSQEKLKSIGLKLGADLPIFLNRHAAFISGIGEKIHNTQNLPELYTILVYPNKLLSTKEVFTALSLPISKQNLENHGPSGISIPTQHEITNWLPFLKNKRNDLESAALSMLPEIKDIISQLASLDGCEFARMSGSGSTCFGIFSEKEKAQMAFTELTNQNPNFWIKLASVCEVY